MGEIWGAVRIFLKEEKSGSGSGLMIRVRKTVRRERVGSL